MVTASETSNVSLYCSVLSGADCWFLDSFKLTWEFENETLENNTIKYTIREHHINNKCKDRRRLLFSLEIINVTYKDDGKYFCQMSYYSGKKRSFVWLHTVAQLKKGTVEALESDHLGKFEKSGRNESWLLTRMSSRKRRSKTIKQQSVVAFQSFRKSLIIPKYNTIQYNTILYSREKN